MRRREFLKAGLATAGALAVGDGFWQRLLAAPANDAPQSSHGPLQPADDLGLRYPEGFSSRLLARAGHPVTGADGLPVGGGFVYPPFPDGAATFPTDDGGWILVVNSENPPPADFPLLPEVQERLGGVSAIRFDRSGGIVDAYRILDGTMSNCAGGTTPWGTWLSCEEFDLSVRGGDTSQAGRVWECDPRGREAPRAHEALGRFKHEAVAFDDLGRLYMTEDIGDGCLYRFTPEGEAHPGSRGSRGIEEARERGRGRQRGLRSPTRRDSLDRGELRALRVHADDSVSWTEPLDPSASRRSVRHEAVARGATIFDGGEGCFFAPHDRGRPGGRVWFTTKGDDRVWALDTAAETIETVYPGPAVDPENRVLSGVDNIVVSPFTRDVYVAEDGGNMEVVVIEGADGRSPTAAPLLRATGPQHGTSNPTEVPSESEITGLAISPDGSRLSFSSQRAYALGVTYELQAPPGTRF